MKSGKFYNMEGKQITVLCRVDQKRYTGKVIQVSATGVHGGADLDLELESGKTLTIDTIDISIVE